MSSSSTNCRKRYIRPPRCRNVRHNNDNNKKRKTVVIQSSKQSASDKKLTELWRSGTLCDVTICVANNETFVAHRNVLAIHSDYMRALFCEDRFRDSTKETIELPEIEADVFRALLEWMYEKEFKVDESMVHLVLEAACRLQCSDLISKLKKKAFVILTHETCLEIWDVAERNYLQDLAASAFSYAADNFDSVMVSTAFKSLSAVRISAFIKNYLLVPLAKEENIFASIVTWAKSQSEPPTANDLGELFEQVRFDLLSDSFLTDSVETEELLLGNRRGVLALVRALRAMKHRSPIPFPEFKRGARFRIRDDVRAVRKACILCSGCDCGRNGLTDRMAEMIGKEVTLNSGQFRFKTWKDEQIVKLDDGSCWPAEVFERAVQE